MRLHVLFESFKIICIIIICDLNNFHQLCLLVYPTPPPTCTKPVKEVGKVCLEHSPPTHPLPTIFVLYVRLLTSPSPSSGHLASPVSPGLKPSQCSVVQELTWWGKMLFEIGCSQDNIFVRQLDSLQRQTMPRPSFSVHICSSLSSNGADFSNQLDQ